MTLFYSANPIATTAIPTRTMRYVAVGSPATGNVGTGVDVTVVVLVGVGVVVLLTTTISVGVGVV